MKAEELMINDWLLKDENEPIKVNGNMLHGMQSFDMDMGLKAIPITPEILEKSGFKECKGSKIGGRYFSWNNEAFECVVIIDYLKQKGVNYVDIAESPSSFTENFESIHIRYVHELQHAIKLCKINKKIILWK